MTYKMTNEKNNLKIKSIKYNLNASTPKMNKGNRYFTILKKS